MIILAIWFFASTTPRRINLLFEAAIDAKDDGVKGMIAGIQYKYDEMFWRKLYFLHPYGLMNRILGKNEVNNFDVVRDKQGYLHFGTRGTEVLEKKEDITPEKFRHLAAFREVCDSLDIPVHCLVFPAKELEGFTELPTGISSHANQNKDELGRVLRELGFHVYDIRKHTYSRETGQQFRFYRTDHHWDLETCFSVHGMYLRHLADNFGYAFPNLERNTNLDNYEVKTLKGAFMGSFGKWVGRYYVPLEDFTVFYPTFDTFMTYEAGSDFRRGALRDTVLFDEHLTARRRRPEDNYYLVFCDGMLPIRHITNRNGRYNLLFVTDSNGMPFISFLSLSFKKITVVDFRLFDELTLDEYIVKNPDYDLVVFLNQYETGFVGLNERDQEQ